MVTGLSFTQTIHYYQLRLFMIERWTVHYSDVSSIRRFVISYININGLTFSENKRAYTTPVVNL